MTGLKIQLATALTDTSLPVVFDDPLMNSGSLLLVDVAHSLGGLGASGGVPADASSCPNIAWPMAKSMIGSGDAVSLAGSWTKTTFGGSSITAERTPKKGLHVAVSQTAHIQGQGMTMNFPPAVDAYILSKPTNTFYFSMWNRLTRLSPSATAANDRFLLVGNSATVYRAQMYNLTPSAFAYPSTTFGTSAFVGSRVAGATDDAAGAKLTNVASDELVGTLPATIASKMLFGSAGINNSSTALQGRGSRIFYRLYVEDLTVSGRSYAQADAADLALYTKDVLTPGGRFYGDTYTAPLA